MNARLTPTPCRRAPGSRPPGLWASVPTSGLVMQLPSSTPGHQAAPSPNCQDTLLVQSTSPIGAFQSLLLMFLLSDPALPGLVRRRDPLLWLSLTLAFPPALTRFPQPSWQGPRRGGVQTRLPSRSHSALPNNLLLASAHCSYKILFFFLTFKKFFKFFLPANSKPRNFIRVIMRRGGGEAKGGHKAGRRRPQSGEVSLGRQRGRPGRRDRGRSEGSGGACQEGAT